MCCADLLHFEDCWRLAASLIPYTVQSLFTHAKPSTMSASGADDPSSPMDVSTPSGTTPASSSSSSSSAFAGDDSGPVVPACRFEVKKWAAVALWSWDIVVDNCAICRNHIMDLCIECQASQVLNTFGGAWSRHSAIAFVFSERRKLAAAAAGRGIRGWICRQSAVFRNLLSLTIDVGLGVHAVAFTGYRHCS